MFLVNCLEGLCWMRVNKKQGNHENQIVNFVNLAAKWFISHKFQTNKDLIWDSFVNLNILF